MIKVGLKPRHSFEQAINYIETNKDVITYPDRRAKLLRNTFELSQLDGIGGYLADVLEEQKAKAEQKELLMKTMAQTTDQSTTQLRANRVHQPTPVWINRSDGSTQAGPTVANASTETDEDVAMPQTAATPPESMLPAEMDRLLTGVKNMSEGLHHTFTSAMGNLLPQMGQAQSAQHHHTTQMLTQMNQQNQQNIKQLVDQSDNRSVQAIQQVAQHFHQQNTDMQNVLVHFAQFVQNTTNQQVLQQQMNDNRNQFVQQTLQNFIQQTNQQLNVSQQNLLQQMFNKYYNIEYKVLVMNSGPSTSQSSSSGSSGSSGSSSTAVNTAPQMMDQINSMAIAGTPHGQIRRAGPSTTSQPSRRRRLAISN